MFKGFLIKISHPSITIKQIRTLVELLRLYKKQGWQSGQKIGGFGFRILLHIFCIADSDSNFDNINV